MCKKEDKLAWQGASHGLPVPTHVRRYWVDTVPRDPKEASTQAQLCARAFLVHNASAARTAGWVTNDYAWRRSDAGLSGDGGASAPALPSLPSGAPFRWLRPYEPSTNCSWEFRLAPSFRANLTLRCAL